MTVKGTLSGVMKCINEWWWRLHMPVKILQTMGHILGAENVCGM